MPGQEREITKQIGDAARSALCNCVDNEFCVTQFARLRSRPTFNLASVVKAHRSQAPIPVTTDGAEEASNVRPREHDRRTAKPLPVVWQTTRPRGGFESVLG